MAKNFYDLSYDACTLYEYVAYILRALYQSMCEDTEPDWNEINYGVVGGCCSVGSCSQSYWDCIRNGLVAEGYIDNGGRITLAGVKYFLEDKNMRSAVMEIEHWEQKD